VAIIGTGPGGGRAAYGCVRRGLNTIVFEKKKIVGEPVHCGECLSEFAVQNTGLRLPVKVIANRVKGVRIVFPNGVASKIVENGFVLKKNIFEQWLIEMACADGCEIRLQTKISLIYRQKTRWVLKTAAGEMYQARILIDASGVTSFANRFLKLNPVFVWVAGFGYELEGLETGDYIDFYLSPEKIPGGYVWAIPKSGSCLNVGIISSEKSALRPVLDRFVGKIGGCKVKIRRTYGGRAPASGPYGKTVADGLMIIGDAAGFTSPLFEGGIHLALKSGQMAARIALAACRQNDFSLNRLWPYQLWWQKEFPLYEAILAGKRRLYRLSDSRLNEMARFMPRKVEHFSPARKLLTGLAILFHDPAIFINGGPQIMKAFEFSRAKCYGW
jgi:digeranylgeranylglycerophospholipid reductase